MLETHGFCIAFCYASSAFLAFQLLLTLLGLSTEDPTLPKRLASFEPSSINAELRGRLKALAPEAVPQLLGHTFSMLKSSKLRAYLEPPKSQILSICPLKYLWQS